MICSTCGHARISHGPAGDDCRTCPLDDPCDGWTGDIVGSDED